MILARCLIQDNHVPTALQAYERQRTGRTANITKVSDRIGTLGSWENPVACMVRSLLLRSLRPLVVKKLVELAGYEF